MSLATARAALLGLAISAALTTPAAADGHAFLNRLNTISTVSSTVPPAGPAAGDQNPYGVAVAPATTGRLVRGDVLVSNFNNAQNQQGTGSSIVEISPRGQLGVFAVLPPPAGTSAVGLTTALVALRNGDVVVGSLPAPGGQAGNAVAGALTILDPSGRVIKTLSGGDLNGPWDMTAADFGRVAVLFITNVLNDTVAANGATVDEGTVIRIVLSFDDSGAPRVLENRVIATGFPEKTDPNALVIGPTGVGLGRDDVLYVADATDNRIAAVPNALTRATVLGHAGDTVATGGFLDDPLGLSVAPGGDILTVNGADGNVVEVTPAGEQVATKTLVTDGAGDLFGLAIAQHGRGVYFVNDAGSGPAANSLQLLQR